MLSGLDILSQENDLSRHNEQGWCYVYAGSIHFLTSVGGKHGIWQSHLCSFYFEHAMCVAAGWKVTGRCIERGLGHMTEEKGIKRSRNPILVVVGLYVLPYDTAKAHSRDCVRL